MLDHTDQATLIVATHHQNRTGNKRLMRLLRAAEARYRIELLREEQILHDQLSDVWDENFVDSRTRVA